MCKKAVLAKLPATDLWAGLGLVALGLALIPDEIAVDMAPDDPLIGLSQRVFRLATSMAGADAGQLSAALLAEFDESELLALLEVARFALAMVPGAIAEEMDLADGVVTDLRGRLDGFMNPGGVPA
ncbi:MAG: hypothetical protein KKB13_30070 [Chloroflexi bacterium]|nr:hypothetical protein [Chloroflexota bacterium]